MRTLNDLEREMRAVARGERKAPPLRPRASELMGALTPANLDLLRIIALENPMTVSDLVLRTGRAQPNISRSLQELARYGFVRLHRDGQKIRPELVARHVNVDLVEGNYNLVPD